MHSNKTVKIYGQYSNKAVVTQFITFIYTYFCLPELDLEEAQSGFRPLYSTHFRNLRMFLNLCTNSTTKCNVCTSTQNNLYLVIGFTYHTSNPVIYISLVSPT